MIFLSYRADFKLSQSGTAQSPPTSDFFDQKKNQKLNSPKPESEEVKVQTGIENSDSVFLTNPYKVTFSAESKLELYKCFPSRERVEFPLLEEILSDWEKAYPNRTVNLIYQNYHFATNNGTELRLRISPKMMNSGQIRKQVQLFTLDVDGDPSPQPLPEFLSGKNAEEIIQILVHEYKLIRTEDVRQYQDVNNQSIQVTKINNQIVNWDSKIETAYFSCQLNPESHFQDCVCSIK